MSIQEKLKALGSSYATKIAAESGVSASQIRRILNGSSYPSLGTIRRIAEALDVTIEELHDHLPPSQPRRHPKDANGKRSTDNKPKLSDEEIESIRRDYLESIQSNGTPNETCRTLAKKYKVSPATVSVYLRGLKIA